MKKNLIRWYQEVLGDNQLYGKTYHNVMRYIRIFNETQTLAQASKGIKRKIDTVVVNLPTSPLKKMRFSYQDCFLLSPVKQDIDIIPSPCFLISPFKQVNQSCDSLDELLRIDTNSNCVLDSLNELLGIKKQCDTKYVRDLIEKNLELYKLKCIV